MLQRTVASSTALHAGAAGIHSATPEVEAIVQELRLHKYDVLALLTARTLGEAASLRRLMEREASPTTPLSRFTMRETEDVVTDVMWLCRIHRLIEEHQPGEGKVIMAIPKVDGRVVHVEWTAQCGRSLRLAIGSVLARRAKRARKGEAT